MIALIFRPATASLAQRNSWCGMAKAFSFRGDKKV